MRTVVTGGAGYIGIPLTKALLESGHQVTVVDNFMYGFGPILHLVPHPKLKLVKTDIRNEDLNWLTEADAVFHLAAISGFPACDASPNSAIQINLDASRRIAERLSPSQMLFFASTTSLYGCSGSLMDESVSVSPVSLYGSTKYQAEQILLERENTVSLRWATVFGVSPRMREGLLVNDFVQKAVREGALVLFSGHSKRTFMHVNDCVSGYLFALEHIDQMRSGIFNMGSEELNFSKREIAEAVHKRLPVEIVDSTKGDADVRHFLVSFRKATELGFRCKYSLDDGIVELIKLYRFYDERPYMRAI